MEKQISMLLLVVVLCVLSNGANGKPRDRETISEINRKLKFLNKPAVKTIKSKDGDIIDCVDIYKQPAFDHPALKNHTIQMKPSFAPATETSSAKHKPSGAFAFQTWQRSGSCPNGTIPIRRIQRKDLLRATSIDDFGRKKYPQNLSASNKTSNQDQLAYFNQSKSSYNLLDRSTAILFTYGYSYIAASADINVWNPYVEKLGEYSSAQIWLKAGAAGIVESVESGWVVNPALYGDSLTRFFAYWTVDTYQKTGCFDLTCTGFVHTSPQVALGATIDPGSSSYTQQFYISVNILVDPQTGNWWLQLNDINVGYWPDSLFYYLKHKAVSVEWGGEVYSPNVRKTPHTKTGMGSGSDAGPLYGWACFIGKPRIMDYSWSYKYPEWVSTWTDEDGCYFALNYREGQANDVEPTFFFGGPGGRDLDRCP